MRTNTLNTENGFTLIEALIAMVILSVGILSLYSMQITSITGNSKASRLTTAATWNMDQVERIIGMDYLDPTITSSIIPYSPDGNYTVSWTISQDQPIPNVKTITVQVQDNNNVLSAPVTLTYIKSEII